MRLFGQRERDREPPLQAARQAAAQRVARFGLFVPSEADRGDQRRHLLLALGGGEAGLVQLEGEAEVVAHAEGRPQRVLLLHIRGALRVHLLGERLSVEGYPAHRLAALAVEGQQIEQRGLARARGAHDRQDVAGAHLRRDPAQQRPILALDSALRDSVRGLAGLRHLDRVHGVLEDELDAAVGVRSERAVAFCHLHILGSADHFSAHAVGHRCTATHARSPWSRKVGHSSVRWTLGEGVGGAGRPWFDPWFDPSCTQSGSGFLMHTRQRGTEGTRKRQPEITFKRNLRGGWRSVIVLNLHSTKPSQAHEQTRCTEKTPEPRRRAVRLLRSCTCCEGSPPACWVV